MLPKFFIGVNDSRKITFAIRVRKRNYINISWNSLIAKNITHKSLSQRTGVSIRKKLAKDMKLDFRWNQNRWTVTSSFEKQKQFFEKPKPNVKKQWKVNYKGY